MSLGGELSWQLASYSAGMPKLRPGFGYSPLWRAAIPTWRTNTVGVLLCLSILMLTAGCQDVAPELGSGKPVHTAGQTVKREMGHFSFKVPAGFVEATTYNNAEGTGKKDSRSAILLPSKLVDVADQNDYILVEALTITPLDLAAITNQTRETGAEVSQTTIANAPALRISEVPLSNREVAYLIDVRGLVEPKTEVSALRITAHWRKYEQKILTACNEVTTTLTVS